MNAKITAEDIYFHFKNCLAPKIEDKYGVKLSPEIHASLRHKIIIENAYDSDGNPVLETRTIREIILDIKKAYQIFPSMRLYEIERAPQEGKIILTMEDCQILPKENLKGVVLTEPSQKIKTLFDELIKTYNVVIKERKEFNDYVFIHGNEFVPMTVSEKHIDLIINHIKKSFEFNIL